MSDKLSDYGFEICDPSFLEDCETCETCKEVKQLYFGHKDYWTSDGHYFCRDCIIGMIESDERDLERALNE